ncbi:MAG TPA: zinc-ribbon domain-containing protein [Candidatus Gordonibacter avicola]|nr:zinc-ribbon domain-containing protein [Candidatus Gordonibacter avicola]
MKTCPACGATNKPIATACEKCGADLPTVKTDFDADQASLDAAAAPKPPASPAAPQAPSAPGAPKAPGAPTPPRA